MILAVKELAASDLQVFGHLFLISFPHIIMFLKIMSFLKSIFGSISKFYET